MSSPTETDSPEVLARIREGLDLVDLVARQMSRRLGHHFSLDEIASFGHEGLLNAARKYASDRGVPFRRWANLRIRGAILDGIRSQSDLPRHVYRRLVALEAGDRMHETLVEEDAASPAASADDADKRLTDYLRGIATAMAMGYLRERDTGDLEHLPDGTPSAEERLERDQLTRAIREILASRPREEQSLVKRHYFDGATFEQVAKELGLSKSWASRLHARAIDALGKELRKRFPEAETG